MPPGVELWGLHLPGRVHRLNEPPLHSLGSAIRATAEVVGGVCSVPFVLFGHSLGATLAYELSCELQGPMRKNLRGLFLSGTASPRHPRRRGPFHQLPDSELIQELIAFGGTGSEILQNAELMALALPTIRADLEMAETWYAPERAPVDVPVFCYGGKMDPDTWPSELESWRNCAGSQFWVRLYEGDHFFLFQNPQFLPEFTRDLSYIL